MSSPVTARDFEAVLFDLDGVLTTTRTVHAAAWKRTFDEFPSGWDAAHDTSTPSFDEISDYASHVDGKPRQEGVRDFLASRSISLPEGTPEEESVWGLGTRKQRYPFTFADRQATTRREPLSAGDYGLIVDGLLQATVERKSLADLVSSLTTGKLKFQLTELSAIPRAAVVVEERYSEVFKLDHVRPSVVADAIAECQIRFPTVPIIFCDTRKLAQEWPTASSQLLGSRSPRRWLATSPYAALKRRRRSRPHRLHRPTYVTGRRRTTSSSPTGDGSRLRSWTSTSRPAPEARPETAIGCDPRRRPLRGRGLGAL